MIYVFDAFIIKIHRWDKTKTVLVPGYNRIVSGIPVGFLLNAPVFDSVRGRKTIDNEMQMIYNNVIARRVE